MTKTIKFIFISLLCCCLPYSLRSQEDTLTGAQLYQKATTFGNTDNYDSALYYYTKAMPVLLVEGDQARYYESWIKRVTYLLDSGSPQEGVAELDQAIKGLEQTEGDFVPDLLSLAYGKMAKVKSELRRDHLGALALLRKAIKIKQNENVVDFNLATLYEDMGSNFFFMRQADSSLYYLKKGVATKLEVLGASDDEIGVSYRFIGTVYGAIGDLKSSRLYYHKAIDILEANQNQVELNALYANYGLVLTRFAELDSALYYLEKQIAIAEVIHANRPITPFSVGYGRNNLANVYKDFGRYEEAEAEHRKALEIFIAHFGKNDYRVAGVYHNMGGYLSSERKEFNKALEYFRETLRIRQSIYKTDHPEIAESLVDVGTNLSALGEHEEGISLIKSGLSMYEKVLKEPDAKNALAYLSLARAHYRLNELEEALKSLEKAIALDQPSTLGLEVYMPGILSTAGVYCMELGRVEEALDYYHEAENRYKQKGLLKGTEQSDLQLNLAKYHLQNDQLDSALSRAHQGVLSLSIDFDNPDPLSQPEPDQAIEAFQMIILSAMKAHILGAKYHESGNRQYLESALDVLLKSEVLIEKVINKGVYGTDYLRNTSYFGDVYDQVQELGYLLFEATGDPSLLESAFASSEKGRSVLLDISANAREVKASLQVSDSLIKKENEIRTSIAYYLSKTQAERAGRNDSLTLAELEGKLFSKNREQEDLEKMLAEEYKDYFAMKYEREVPDITSVQSKLGSQTTVIEYYEAKEAIFAFAIDRDQFTVKKIDIPDNYSDLISSYTQGIAKSNFAQFKSASQALYDLLVSPLSEVLTRKELIVIPDGNLWNLNFDLLIKDDSGTDYNALNYLLNDLSISYAYSTRLLFDSKKSPPKNKQLLAFSFSEEALGEQVDLNVVRNKDMSELPGAVREIRGISQMVDGDFFYGKAASESNFKALASEYSILHLALHGEINDKDINASKLFFAANPADSTEDNFLYPFELYGMDLNAQLVVLSACNTGAGNIRKGEGIMSLGRAFQYAGAGSLLLSQWELVDELTPKIVESFYKYLTEGMPKNQALRQAKLDFISGDDPSLANPYYWGGFVLLGNTSTIELETKRPYWLYALLFVLMIFIAYRFRKKAARNN